MKSHESKIKSYKPYNVRSKKQ